MFRPNTTALIHRKLVRRTAHGKALYNAPVTIPIAVCALGETVIESSVRADSSASRGAAEIAPLYAKFLIPANILVTKGDVIEYAGELVEVAGVRRRNNVLGRHDHNEVDGNLKGEL